MDFCSGAGLKFCPPANAVRYNVINGILQKRVYCFSINKLKRYSFTQKITISISTPFKFIFQVKYLAVNFIERD